MTSRVELGPIRATFRGPTRPIKIVAISLAVFFAVVMAYRYWETGYTDELVDTARIVIGFWFGLIALYAVGIKLLVTQIHEFGLDGRNFWGLPCRFKWTDIQNWRIDRNSWLSFVVLTERHSNRDMWIFRDVYFSNEFQDQLRHFPDIPIPEMF